MGVRWLVGLVFLASLCTACGDDSGGNPPIGPSTGDGDTGDGDGDTGDGDTGDGDTGDGDGDTGSPTDAGTDGGQMDSSVFDPFDYDASGDYDPDNPDGPAPPVPDGWNCLDTLWADGYCDCGCSITDADCVKLSCTTPGCTEPTCDACFAKDGTWQSCQDPPSQDDWRCSPDKAGDGSCDCGCGIPDEICNGKGCTQPGCWAGIETLPGGGSSNICDRRHAPTFDGESWTENELSELQPPTEWKCGRERWGGEDGCDCGCGAPDPDCGNDGCTGPRCADAACDVCHMEGFRPYPCAAASAGWDDEIGDGVTTPSLCDANKHFGTGDGCDCGCGGLDPDCSEGKSCGTLGCTPAAGNECVRCTYPWATPDVSNGALVGCAIPQAWFNNGCSAANYGTGDGCDCGCGAPDPDCDGLGVIDPNATPTNDCDVCNDGLGGFKLCPGWTCGTDAFDTVCDCGCGVVDPFCRDSKIPSCTTPGCTDNLSCGQCSDASGTRGTCAGTWTKREANGDGKGAACQAKQYGAGDGICDCGCGALDPDCDDGEGCTEEGCSAPGCDVCHVGNNGIEQVTCFEWTCAPEKLDAGDGCDCGCGAHDPDCDAVTGLDCRFPGCRGSACEICHDDLGREVPCP